MKYSLKRHFAIILISLVAGTILMCLLLNSTLLERYYTNNKINALIKAYGTINEASNNGTITSDGFDIELQKIYGKYNITVLVADSDSETVKTSMSDPNYVVKHLLNNIIMGVDQGDVLRETDNYKMQIVTDTRTQTEYIEMWGVLDSGNLFMLRSALEGIRESVAISNQFLTYVGVVAIIVSALLVVWLTNRITKPILELADISERMKHLDFNAKYTGNDRTEISSKHRNLCSIIPCIFQCEIYRE